ncbi:Mth-2 [Aphelenchoides besseyi]|nr:Mth-2 [Aphelenchoides besseyi]KAI6211003.1 Mth-2 [Aphelenchoides besseyi]
MFIVFILLGLSTRLVFGAYSESCTEFDANYNGYMNFTTSGENLLGPPVRMSIKFSYANPVVQVNLIDYEFEDKSYYVMHTVGYEFGLIQTFECCKGFCKGSDKACYYTVPKDTTLYSFSLCAERNTKKCEYFFEAIINGDDFHPDIGRSWSYSECERTIQFSRSDDPPNMDYCVCCNGYDPELPGTCNGQVKKDSTTTVTAKTTSIPTTNKSIYRSTTLIPTEAPFSSLPVSQTTQQQGFETTKNQVVASTTEPYSIDCNNPNTPMEQVYCSNKTLTQDTVTNYINQTSNAIDSSSSLNSSDVYMLSHIFTKIAEVKGMKLEDCKSVYGLYDKTLHIPDDQFRAANLFDSSNRIRESIHNFLVNAEYNLEFLNGTNLAMKKHHTRTSCTNSTGLADYGDSFGWNDQTRIPDASIEIPRDVACSSSNQTIPLFLVAYRKTQLFMSSSLKRRNLQASRLRLGLSQIRQMHRLSEAEPHEVNEEDRCRVGLKSENHQIVSAVLLNAKPNNDVKQKVFARIRYSKKGIKRPLHGEHEVSWWTNTNEWSEARKCDTKEKDGFFEAECLHLTDFTLLVDGLSTDPSLCSTSLLILGNLLVIASAMCLFIMALIQYANLSKSARVKMSKFFATFPSMRFRVELLTFVYTTTLFLFYAFFGVFSDSRRAFGQFGCSFFAAITYFLLLCCIFLTLFTAWRVLKLFAWNSRMERSLTFLTQDTVILSTTLIFSLLISLLAFLLDPSFYRRDDNFCWIRPVDLAWAVVVPTSILIFNGVVCLLIVTIRFFPNIRCCSPIRRLIRTDTNTLSKGNQSRAKDKLLALLNMSILLGTPWSLQYLTLFTPEVTFWHYLFTIFNGSQGIILFAIFIYRRRYRSNVTKSTEETQTQSRTFNETIETFHESSTVQSQSSKTSELVKRPPRFPAPQPPIPKHRGQEGFRRPEDEAKRRSRAPSNAWRYSKHVYDNPVHRM